jgi:hypothetical protein
VPATTRDLRLDFFRGIALMLIFIDHIPENILAYFTLQGVQFFDAAEVFIFISGFTAALVYGRVMLTQGIFYAGAQVLRRAWQLYVAHIFLFMIFVAEVSYTVTTFNNPMYSEEMRVADFLGEPHIAIVKALLLEFQPTFLDILPLYIVLLIAFPVMLLGLRRHWLIVLVPSFALYAAIQATGFAVPAYPQGHVWFFNPLAWQFLFAVGAALGYAQLRGTNWPRFWRMLLPVAVAVVAIASLVRISWTLHGLWEGVPGVLLKQLWPVDKNDLSPVRLVPFFAIVLVVALTVPPQPAFMRSAAARPFLLCGRQSLEVFCLSILLSALAHFVLAEFASSVAMQLAVNMTGILMMILTAKLIDWYKTMGRTPVPLPVAGNGE